MHVRGKESLKIITIMSFYVKFPYVRKIYCVLLIENSSLSIKTQDVFKIMTTKYQGFNMEIELYLN